MHKLLAKLKKDGRSKDGRDKDYLSGSDDDLKQRAQEIPPQYTEEVEEIDTKMDSMQLDDLSSATLDQFQRMVTVGKSERRVGAVSERKKECCASGSEWEKVGASRRECV